MTDRELMQMVLEALEYAKYGMAECYEEVGFDFANEQHDVEQAITALRERLKQPEHSIDCALLKIPSRDCDCTSLDRMAENARELGLDYEPVQEPVAHSIVAGALFDFMGWLTTRRERLVLSSSDDAAPAADAIKDFAQMRSLSINDAQVQEWQKHLATPPRQEQPEQEPVAWWLPKHPHPDMVSRVKWSDECEPLYTTPPRREWEQRPVAGWTGPYPEEQAHYEAGYDAGFADGVKSMKKPTIPGPKPPQRREWQELTEEEIDNCTKISDSTASTYNWFARAIEAKLKEKNS